MSDKPCPLCGRDMTAIEVHAGRGELYCVHCDLVIGGNEARTPDELMELLGQRTCRMETAEGCQNWHSCSECDADYYTDQPINYCPNCGRKVVAE